MTTIAAEHPARLRSWRSRPPRDGLRRGLVAGLIPNVVVFLALFATPWVDEHVGDGLALGVLYAGPVLVALVGLARLLQPGTRRRGAGLLLAAPLTVAVWQVAAYLSTQAMLAQNTPGG